MEVPIRNARIRILAVFFGILSSTAVPASAQEVEVRIEQSLPYSASGAGVLVGLPLHPRLVALVGARATVEEETTRYYGEDYRSTQYGVGVPVELKLYLRDPGESGFVPTVRVGAAFSYFTLRHPDANGGEGFSTTYQGLELSALGGGHYLFADGAVGVTFDMGVTGGWRRTKYSQDHERVLERTLGVGWHTGLVFRL